MLRIFTHMTVHRAFVKSATAEKETPLMKQYNSIKAKYPDALLLFRVGDFYETFHQDAVKASKILGIVLTKRSNGSASEMELAGFPYHALDTYLPKLVRAGQRVAICDQLEDPKTAKTIVKRGVTELVTPGVAFSEKILDHKSNNFLAVIIMQEKNYGIALIDVSTGEFLISQGEEHKMEKLLQNFSPSEVVIQKNYKNEFARSFGTGHYTYVLDDWIFSYDYGRDTLLKHFNVSSLKGFGVEDLGLGIIAGGAALHYLSQMQQNELKHISKVTRINDSQYVWLDKFTVRNLELVGSPHEKAKTLIEILDRTISPMGARLMKRWLLFPLCEKEKIEERLAVVDYFYKEENISGKIAHHIKLIGDLERIISRVAIRKINPREITQLNRALNAIEPVKKLSVESANDDLKILADRLNPCHALSGLISKTLKPEPSALITKGGVIADGFSAELDELRQLAFSGKDYLLKLQQREIEQTGISSLKVGFNSVFGYYIEVTNAHKNKVPAEWIRKQTLTNAERYITSELKEYEEKILGAEEKILALEAKIYDELVSKISEYILPVQSNAAVIAQLDCLLSFANVSRENDYSKPVLNDGLALNIKKGRHPVLEKQMPLGEQYIANDLFLDNETQQIIIITGPNMSGKSALLRQTALIVIMAQAGCFVPAGSAEIGIVDKIFTRVGASDNISSGESTFMVEMNETASILNNISERSLIVLDEIGRGTSTYDGISIAWAIAEYLHEHPLAKAKTLFATHYHELNEIAASYPRIKNFHVAVKEAEKKVLFLRKLKPGGSEHSFGIHVAKMAGMPSVILERADKMLALLEKAHSNSELLKNTRQKEIKDAMQLSFFKLDDPVLEKIREEIQNTDINSLTPVEALLKLNEIKKLIG